MKQNMVENKPSQFESGASRSLDLFPTSHTWGSALSLSHPEKPVWFSEAAMHSVTAHGPQPPHGPDRSEVILEPVDQLHKQAQGKPVETAPANVQEM